MIEALQLGAATVQFGSVLLTCGYGIITRTVQQLEDWMDRNGYRDTASLRAAALQYLHSYDELYDHWPRKG